MAGGVVLIIALSAGAAQAASVSTTGAKASNSGTKLTITDTADDGNAAYTNWNSSTNNRLETANANGNSKSITVSPLNNFRACRDRGTLYPDNCTSYVSP